MFGYFATLFAAANESATSVKRLPCYRIVHNMESGDDRIRDFTLPQGFESTGWSDDGLASFIDPESGLILLVDEADPSQRRFHGSPRFTLYEINPFSEPLPGNPLIRSDDYDAVVRIISDCKRRLQNLDGIVADAARLHRAHAQT